MSNPYETDRLLSEYLLFHYAPPEEILPPAHRALVSPAVLDFPARCAALADPLPNARALDLGCAVGRSAFELARRCDSVLGIDFSHRFIAAASALQRDGRLHFQRIEEGRLTTPSVALVPAGIDRSRVRFETGDAVNLPPDPGSFDIVLAANLLCRLPEPRRFLARAPGLVRPGGQLLLTTPCTWLEEFTPAANWLGGLLRHGSPFTTLDGLHEALDGSFDLEAEQDLPFLIREHRRKYQLTVALATIWRRRENGHRGAAAD